MIKAANEAGKIKRFLQFLPDTQSIFDEWENLIIQHNVTGRMVHDARLVAAMIVHQLTHVLTFNTSDFNRFSRIITVVDPTQVV